MDESLVSRRDWLKSTGAITFAATSWTADTNGDEHGNETVKLQPHRNLFFDDSLIESRRGVVRTMHPARKHARPVLVADQPWEGRIASVLVVEHLPERNLYQMWGQCYPSRRGFIYYAESRDGVQWQKPKLGVIEFRGSTRNNLIMERITQGWIMFDPAETDPQRRYKGLTERGRNFFTMYSPDGIHWTRKGELAHGLPLQDDSPGLFYDASRRKYVFVKRKLEGEHRRMIQTAVSDDFIHWKVDPHVFASDERDALRAAQRGVDRMDFYGLTALPYEGIYLGWVNCFYLWRMNPGEKRIFHDGPVETELVWSRDAVHWNRVAPGQAVIPRGAAGAFDDGMVGAAKSAVVLDGEVRIYYNGSSCTHGCGGGLFGEPITADHAHADDEPRSTSVGLARWQLDRFVSLDADDAMRSVITRPLDFSGKSLIVNADASSGLLQVELQNSAGQVIAGYEAANCKPFRGDELRRRVQWKGHHELPASRPLRIRFVMRNASLYSFQIKQGGE